MIKMIFRRIKGEIFKVTHKQIRGNSFLVKDGCDKLKLSNPSRLILNGDLRLNTNRVGKNCRSSILRMDENSVLECHGFSFMYGADIILFKGSHLELGKGSFINSDCKIRCHKEITIGEGCAISHDFTVMDSDAHELDGSRNTNPVHIGNHVWIGTRVTILNGVTLKSKLKSVETEVEIDGGKLMGAIFVTCLMVQMGYPTGVVEVRSQMAAYSR